MHKKLKGKQFTWWHFSHLEEVDFEVLEKEFKFHPLDFDDLREENEIPKLDAYKYYLFGVLNVPKLDVKADLVQRNNLAVFIGKDYLVTVTKHPIDSVDRFFARATRSSGLRRDAMGKSTGYFLYKLLDYVFRDAKVVLRELVRETEHVESALYDSHSKTITRRLGILRRNILYLRHIIDPQRLLIDQFSNSGKSFISKDLTPYFDDVKDTLDGVGVVTENLKNIIGGLFDVNEAFLSHRTNEIIRLLTIISVVLMPPTLITSYYGMNVDELPFANDAVVVSTIIMLSLAAFLLVIIRLDKKR